MNEQAKILILCAFQNLLHSMFEIFSFVSTGVELKNVVLNERS